VRACDTVTITRSARPRVDPPTCCCRRIPSDETVRPTAMSEFLSAIGILMLVLSPLIIPIAVAVMHGLARWVSTARAARIQVIESAQTASRKRPQPVTTQIKPGHVPLRGTTARHIPAPQGGPADAAIRASIGPAGGSWFWGSDQRGTPGLRPRGCGSRPGRTQLGLRLIA
jgi:hypothetical protein